MEQCYLLECQKHPELQVVGLQRKIDKKQYPVNHKTIDQNW